MAEIYAYTELEAVNEVLAAIGDSAVSSLDNLTDIDAINARKVLASENRKFQSRGWSFNQNEAYVLNPDVITKKIMWADDLLYIESDDAKYVKKGYYVYNMTTQSYIFESPLTVEAILMVPFEDMPVQARDYIVARAAKVFEMRYLGDQQLNQLLAQAEKEAWSYFQEYEMENNDYNILNNANVTSIIGG